MNERHEQLLAQAHIEFAPDSKAVTKRFAELIIQECIDTIEYRAPGQMGEEGKGWTNGYDDGLKTAAWLIKKHFGVKE